MILTVFSQDIIFLNFQTVFVVLQGNFPFLSSKPEKMHEKQLGNKDVSENSLRT